MTGVSSARSDWVRSSSWRPVVRAVLTATTQPGAGQWWLNIPLNTRLQIYNRIGCFIFFFNFRCFVCKQIITEGHITFGDKSYHTKCMKVRFRVRKSSMVSNVFVTCSVRSVGSKFVTNISPSMISPSVRRTSGAWVTCAPCVTTWSWTRSSTWRGWSCARRTTTSLSPPGPAPPVASRFHKVRRHYQIFKENEREWEQDTIPHSCCCRHPSNDLFWWISMIRITMLTRCCCVTLPWCHIGQSVTRVTFCYMLQIVTRPWWSERPDFITTVSDVSRAGQLKCIFDIFFSPNRSSQDGAWWKNGDSWQGE